MDIRYRQQAKEALERANSELAANDAARVRYAALELRTAIESLAYDRILLYRTELPAEALGTWQPRKVMEVLLELDPQADKSSSLRFAPESSPGVTAGPFQSMGSERVISNKEIKQYYDRLGSYLHAPTVKQVESGMGLDLKRARERCNEIVSIVAEVLASSVYNINLRTSAALTCSRCGESIIRRIPPEHDQLEAACPKCVAGYIIRRIGNGQVEWIRQQLEVRCGNPSCNEQAFVWPDEVREGAHWKCGGCGGRNMFRMEVKFDPDATKGQAAPS